MNFIILLKYYFRVNMPFILYDLHYLEFQQLLYCLISCCYLIFSLDYITL